MAHRFDVSLKALFLRDGNGIIRRRLFGAPVTEHLATEQPQVLNHRADMVVRTSDNSLHHVEFQVTNDPAFGLRMFEYYAYLVSAHKQHVFQTVLYLGQEPLRLESGYKSPSLDFRFEVINLRELDAEPLLASDDWADIALALLARGDKEKALAAAVSQLSRMQHEDRAWASGTLLLLSGILKMENTVNERMKEAGMIDVMENKVLAPLLLKQFELGQAKGVQQGLQQGVQQGLQQGVQQGLQGVLLEQLTEKFGPLPAWAVERVHSASNEVLHTWAKRVLRSTSLDDTLQ